MDPKHTELEYKFDADHVSETDFRRVMMLANPTAFANFKHQDTFWKNGEKVIRHRIKGDGSMELTVKQRMSQETLVERVEVNLGLSPKTGADDVAVFLGATGFEKLFTLKKSYIDLFDFKRDSYEVEVALYRVASSDSPTISRKFIEVEIKPGALYPLEWLDFWRDWLRCSILSLAAPINTSLFEYYSALRGTNYKI